MKIGMDTDAVRSMSIRLRQTADSMDTSLASIKQSVSSAGWQSQAREEFIVHLEMLRRSSTQSARAMRMMATAADRKAEQWEAIANVFNGPFHYLGDVWSSVVGFFAGIGGGIWNAITSIRLPSVPEFIGGAAIGIGVSMLSPMVVIGGISVLHPDWKWEKPDWLKRIFEKGKVSGGGSWGSEEGSTGVDDRGELSEGEAATEASTMPPSAGYDKNNLSSGEYLKSELNTSPTVPEDKKSWKGYCAGYVSAVVPEIGGVAHAKDFIGKHSLPPFAPSSDLRTQLEPGDVVVWDAGQMGANAESGHAAVIVEVHEDYVVLAESSWGKANYDSRYADNPYVGRIAASDNKLNGAFVWSNPNVNQDAIQVKSGS